MKAHSTNRLTDVTKKKKKKKTIDDVEKDRSSISFTMNEMEQKKYDAYKIKQERKERYRMKTLETKDHKIQDIYQKTNKSMLGSD